MTRSPMVKRLLALALLCTGVATLSGCGPGGGSDGGGRTAGIEGTGITSGFGSVYVGGTEFATDGTTFIRDGQPSSEQALRVGDVVTVQGEIDADGNARARRIVVNRVLEGPIAQIERAPDDTGHITILGQRVRFDANTHFVPEGVTADKLGADDRVAISGIGNGEGHLRATAIERVRHAAAEPVTVEGRVADLGQGDFRIGDLRVQYTSAAIDATQPALANGDYVRVTGHQSDTDTPLIAARVDRPTRRIGEDAQRVFIQGMVSELDDNDHFSVAGQRVDASDAERSGASAAALTGDETVLVRGIRRDDRIQADMLRVEAEPNVTLRAQLDTVEDAGERVVLLGSEWTIKTDTRYIDQTEPRERKLRLNRLNAGDTIQAVGYEGTDGLVMTRLDRIPANAEGRAFLRAPLESVQRNGTSIELGLAGTTVTADTDRTVFMSATGQTITAGAFLQAALPGMRIAVEGPPNPDRINVATTVTLLE